MYDIIPLAMADASVASNGLGDTDELLERAAGGDMRATQELFRRHPCPLMWPLADRTE